MTLHTGPMAGAKDPSEPADPMAAFEDAETLGLGFRAVRRASGRSLDELSKTTRIPPKYLTSLEHDEFSHLPSRVFALGYVRGYAQALGLDDQTAIERFKRESPDTTVPLQAPTGIAFEDVKRRTPQLVAAFAVVLIVVIGWNVFQRISRARDPQPSDIATVPETWTTAATLQDGVRLGAPQPAPPDQTTPKLYITPGLEAQLTGVDPNDPEAVAQATAALRPQGPVQAAFNPRGAVYGAAATASAVTLQARRPTSLVVRVGDRVLFARVLAEGEAWRAPIGLNAVVDASEPTAIDVYLNGEHGGPLETPLTQLTALNTRAETLARQAAADIEARREAQLRLQAALAAEQAGPTP
jgi:hypothetical protein